MRIYLNRWVVLATLDSWLERFGFVRLSRYEALSDEYDSLKYALYHIVAKKQGGCRATTKRRN